MKFILIFFLVLNTAYSFTLKFDKNFEIDLMPDLLSSNISISVTAPSEKNVLEILSNYSEFIKGFKELEIKGGRYTIFPNYHFDKGRRFKNGYRGNMNYSISSPNPNDLTSFLYKLEKKNQYKNNVDISIQSINWKLSQKESISHYDDLRLSAIKWSINYANDLSTQLNKNCQIKVINIFPTGPSPVPMPMGMERDYASVRSEAISAPEQTSQKIKLLETLEIDCK